MQPWLMALLLMTPSWAEEPTDVTGALDLPMRAQRLRDAGMSPEQVREALEAARDEKLPAHEAEALLKVEEEAVKEHGPVDNFGAVVQEHLRQGKRGKDLAQAIREEHRERGRGGKGPGEGKGGKARHGEEHPGKGKGPGGEKGKAPDADKGKGPDGDKGKGKGPNGDKGKGNGKGSKGKGKAK